MLNLKFEQVRAFLHVARDHGNKRAANALHLTEPAITARIRNLEAALGTELFERSEGRRRLSKQGELLLEYADKLEDLVCQIERDVAAPTRADGYLRIGVAETIAQSWMPEVIRELNLRYPNLKIELVIDISSRLMESFANREIDIAIANGVSGDRHVKRRPLSPVPLQWCASVADPVEDPDKARAFFGKPIITYPKNTEAYREMKRAVWEQAGQNVPLFPSSSMPSAIQLVAAEVGVAALPGFLAKRALSEGRVKFFDPGWRPRPLEYAIHFVCDPVYPIVEAFAEIAGRIAAEAHGALEHGGACRTDQEN